MHIHPAIALAPGEVIVMLTIPNRAVDRIAGTWVTAAQSKELRPGSSGASEVRILYIFDPAAAGLVLYFLAAAGAQLRARDTRLLNWVN